MLSDQDVVRTVRAHLESKFPKDCQSCGRRYTCLADYLLRTTHVGHPVSIDDPNHQNESRPLFGAISYADCRCGSTMSLSSKGLDRMTMWRLLQWAALSMARRGMSIGEILSDLRRRIDAEVLDEYAARNEQLDSATLHS